MALRQPSLGEPGSEGATFDLDDVQNLGILDREDHATNPACGDLMATPQTATPNFDGPVLTFGFAPGSSDPAPGLLRHFDAIDSLRARAASGQRYILLGYGGQQGTAETQQNLAALRLAQVTKALIDLNVLSPVQIFALVRPTPPFPSVDWDFVSVFRMASGAR